MAIEIGKLNLLTVLDVRAANIVLTCDDGQQVMLKKRELRDVPERGSQMEVFVFTDNEGKIWGTTMRPVAELGQCAYMKVIEETKIGAFLNWGIEKDLFVPFSQQKERMREGFTYLVYILFNEDASRIIGSSKIEQFIQNENLSVKEGKEVNLLICEKSDLGVNVIVEDKHWGLLYKNEIFQKIKKGDRVKGFIKKVREDGKLDVSLQEQGYDEVFSASMKILGKLKEEGPFLPLNDKSEPGQIYNMLEMSKKIFKKAIGALYKDRKITIEDSGIRIAK
jgi:uncharacterized protein